MANWIAGFWFARQFNLKFANIPFSSKRWDDFLGFGSNEIQVDELIAKGYHIRRLPKFEEENQEELALNKAIINSYSGSKVVFLAIQDQGYSEQFGIINDLQQKFYNAEARKNDQILYDKDRFNIAIHVRRTVIIENKVIFENEEVKAKRWLNNDYYETVLKQVVENLKVDKPLSIWIFSTGPAEEFKDFEKYGDVHFCSDMNEYDSFAHLVFADLLITSKSSFSYKPALMNKGIKVCPKNFWHGYPNQKDWVLCENDGTFETLKLNEALK